MALKPILAGLFSFCAIVLAERANAEAIDGNQLYSACTSEGVVEQSFCAGYIIGALEGLKYGAFIAAYRVSEDQRADVAYLDGFANFILGYCIPANANNEQVSDVVISYLRDNPSVRHNSARTLVTDAFRAASQS